MNAAAKITQPPPTLLVVDDDPQLRFATVRILEQAGYTVLQGATAAEALALTRVHRPALVLLDVMLPDGDGREVARQLKTDPALTGVFVILVSGLKINPEDQAMGLSEGLADGYILRPVSTPVLLGWVEALLRLRATQEELRESEQAYRNQFAANSMAMLLLDATDGAIIDANAAALRFYGYPREQLLAMRITDINTLPAAEVRQAMASVSQEQGLRFEFQHRLADGSVRAVEVSASQSRFGKRKVLHSIIYDITERKQAAMLQETVYRIAEAAQSAESLQELYPQIHRHIAGVMSAENFYIALYDESRDLIRFVYWVDQRESFTTKPVHPGTGPTAHVLRTGQSLLFSTKEVELGLNIGIELMGEPSEVWLGVPLMVHGKTMGVMAVQHYTNPQAYTEQDQRILEFVSAQVAAAIHRKQAEESLRLLEKRNHALIENAPDGIVLLDAAGRFTFGSPSVYRLFSYNPTEIVGTSIMEKVHPDDLPSVMDVIRKAKRFPSERFTLEYRFRHQDGGYRWLESVYTNLLPDPDVNAIVVNFHDITGRKLAEAALRESEARFRIVFEYSPLGKSITGIDGTLKTNKAFCDLLGYSEKELSSKKWREITHPDDIRESAHIFQSLLAGEMLSANFEKRYLHKNGDVVWAEVRVLLYKDDSGKPLFFITSINDITERKRIETALHESEARYQDLYENAPDMYYSVDPATTRIIQCNRTTLQATGYSRDEIIGHSVFEIYHPDCHEKVKEALRQFVSTGEVRDTELQLKRKDGNKLEVSLNVSAVRDADGKILYSRSSWRDITGRKQAEEALQNSYRQITLYAQDLSAEITERRRAEEVWRRYEFIVNTSGELMTLIDINHVYIAASNAYCRAHNKSRAEILGKTVSHVWGEAAYLAQIKDKLDQSFAGKELSHQAWVEFVVPGRRYVDVTYHPYHNNKGDITHVVVVSRDITEYKRTEEALQNSIQQLVTEILERQWVEKELAVILAKNDQLLGAIPLILIGVQQDGYITHWNQPAETVFGIISADTIETSFFDQPIQWDWGQIKQKITECIEKNTIIRLRDVKNVRPDKNEVFFNITITPFGKETATSKGGALLLAEDITDRKILEGQLVQAQKLEAIGQLAAGIAHEINTPTQYIGDNLGFLQTSLQKLCRILEKYNALLETAKSGAVPPELITDLEAFLKTMRINYLLEEMPVAVDEAIEGVERVSGIVRAMKTFSHPGVQEKIAADINRVIESTITIARHEWKYVAEVETDFDPTLPPVPCLPGEFNQTILNILINAAHAIADVAGDGSAAKGLITVSTRREGNMVKICISDTGAGIPEAVRDKIFDPFFTTKEVGKGTGQGLAIARSVIVDKHNGSITFDTQPGKGTTFIIRLPLETDPAETEL